MLLLGLSLYVNGFDDSASFTVNVPDSINATYSLDAADKVASGSSLKIVVEDFGSTQWADIQIHVPLSEPVPITDISSIGLDVKWSNYTGADPGANFTFYVYLTDQAGNRIVRSFWQCLDRNTGSDMDGDGTFDWVHLVIPLNADGWNAGADNNEDSFAQDNWDAGGNVTNLSNITEIMIDIPQTLTKSGYGATFWFDEIVLMNGLDTFDYGAEFNPNILNVFQGGWQIYWDVMGGGKKWIGDDPFGKGVVSLSSSGADVFLSLVSALFWDLHDNGTIPDAPAPTEANKGYEDGYFITWISSSSPTVMHVNADMDENDDTSATTFSHVYSGNTSLWSIPGNGAYVQLVIPLGKGNWTTTGDMADFGYNQFKSFQIGLASLSGEAKIAGIEWTSDLPVFNETEPTGVISETSTTLHVMGENLSEATVKFQVVDPNGNVEVYKGNNATISFSVNGNYTVYADAYSVDGKIFRQATWTFSVNAPGLSEGGKETSGSEEKEANLPSLSEVKAFPNPVSLSANGKAYVGGLPGSAVKVVVFDVRGFKVAELEVSGGYAEWNLENELGSKVVPGVYLFVAKDSSGKVVAKGKIAVKK